MACNNHTRHYYCDECSPPSERGKDEASSRVWYDLSTNPNHLDTTLTALTRIADGDIWGEKQIALFARETLNSLGVTEEGC